MSVIRPYMPEAPMLPLSQCRRIYVDWRRFFDLPGDDARDVARVECELQAQIYLLLSMLESAPLDNIRASACATDARDVTEWVNKVDAMFAKVQERKQRFLDEILSVEGEVLDECPAWMNLRNG